MAVATISPDHLYVMQAADGRIKVGRSRDPEKRRRDLQSTVGLTIRLCLVLRHRGSDEQSIHEACKPYRLRGEWFEHTLEAREALMAAIGQRLRFPFLLNTRLPFASEEATRRHEEAQRREAAAAFAWLAEQIPAARPKRGRRKRVRFDLLGGAE